MPHHFLDYPGLQTLKTRQYQLTRRIVGDVAKILAMGCVHGPTGTGKTFAVEAGLEDMADFPIVYCSLETIAGVTPYRLAGALFQAVTGAEAPHTRSRFPLLRSLEEYLAAPERLIVLDEAQRLTGHCLEMVRHLHDSRRTRFAVLYVGGDGCWERLSRSPMLASRIYRRLPFMPLSPDAVPRMIRRFHAIYAQADDELLTEINETYANGVLRNWASFTISAAQACAELGKEHIDDVVVDTVMPMLGEGIED
ncbi:ATP-binding protein [Actinomadura geliboluensis]|uniref:ATP-binding protein n=1 Tax=Actinomadura geliboluensis TaxID=882440 RepID=A0A5S4H800_9ACTN|nr:ATP-binding protein [Actinomadura geliboluensis]TMR40891.1 ATP-binding protein [Actinomadura geliboluensis]